MGEYITDVIDNGIGKFLLFAHHKDPRGEREAERFLQFSTSLKALTAVTASAVLTSLDVHAQAIHDVCLS